VPQFLPSKDREYLESHGFVFEEIEAGGQKGVVLREVVLPPGKYDVPKTDVLLLLPGGYPDAPPDMFYLYPWVRLAGVGRYPRAADQAVAFANLNWQRWSRHSDQWRAGRDGIWTMIKRFEHAVEIAE
jgi:hypothetical protein